MARGARVYHIGLHEAALCGGLRHRFPGMAGRDKDIDPASELAEEDDRSEEHTSELQSH